MSFGQVQTVLVCQNSSQTDTSGLCPGQAIGTTQAYLLDPSTQTYFEQNQTFDYSVLGQFWAFAFISVIIFWAFGKACGSVLSALRH
jgi:hypothetical protein